MTPVLKRHTREIFTTQAGFGAALGSNDLDLDRGALRGSRIVKFERVGRKAMMVQANE